MRIKTIRISGFKAIQHCAKYLEPEGRNDPYLLTWDSKKFEVNLSFTQPFLYGVIGPNCCGKSSILYALAYFFGSTAKLRQDLFHGGNNQHPIIVEVVLQGIVPIPGTWHEQNCARVDTHFELVVAKVWLGESRTVLIKRLDGSYYKAGTNDNKELAILYPEYRLIAADSKLSEEANPEKANLVNDLIKELLDRRQSSSNRSIVRKLEQALLLLGGLVNRSTSPSSAAWRDIENLESKLSLSIKPITPGEPKVRIQIQGSIPTLEQLFTKGRIRIDDGLELDFSEHGLGLQRSFVVSTLHTWCDIIGRKNDSQDYVFGFEEPELYLHPHAIRILLHAFENIAENDQIIFSSHSTEFVNRVPLENVICVKRCQNVRSIIQPELSHLSVNTKSKVQRYLREDRSDMLFARAVLLVEGQSEVFALPGMARTLGYDFDRSGVSVVFVNGRGNFATYHVILNSFGIPHVILADGDGNRVAREQEYKRLNEDSYVVDYDFEFLVASTLSRTRLLSIVNECRSRRGVIPLINLATNGLRAENLVKDWWGKIKEEMDSDIAAQHRPTYSTERLNLRTTLQQIATRVIANNHHLPDAINKKRAKILQSEGKPLAGRVLGEELKRSEIRKMTEIVKVIERAIELSEQ